MTTAVTEKGIILDAMRVRAALDGRLTQIRARVKPQPKDDTGGFVLCDGGVTWMDYPGWAANPDALDLRSEWTCPYAIGTRLWVREALKRNKAGAWEHAVPPSAGLVASCDEALAWAKRMVARNVSSVSASHMPKWASRLTLEVKAVRVERVNEISEVDALAEGCAPIMRDSWRDMNRKITHVTAREEFETHYDSLHGPGSFAAGHWVWVLEVEKVTF